MELLASMAAVCNSGVHIHVAEDPCDEEDCRRKYGLALIDRLDRLGLLRRGSVLRMEHIWTPARSNG